MKGKALAGVVIMFLLNNEIFSLMMLCVLLAVGLAKVLEAIGYAEQERYKD